MINLSYLALLLASFVACAASVRVPHEISSGNYTFRALQETDRSSWRADLDAVKRLKIPKVALMFLTRGDMPHEASWAAWLSAARGLVPVDFVPRNVCTSDTSLHPQDKTAADSPVQTRLGRKIFSQQALFNIYLHPAPDFPGYSQDSVFHGHSVRLRVKVSWGTHSEVEAMRLLLKAALLNPVNQRFVYMCETTVPLYPPTVTYLQLMSNEKSRINACKWPEPGNPALSLNRWQEDMMPIVPMDMWRKSGQWVELVRRHAEAVAGDSLVVTEFQEHCKEEANEHYFGVVLALNGFENQTTCASDTISSQWPWREAWKDGGNGEMLHPVTYQADQINADLFVMRRQGADLWEEMGHKCKDVEAIRSAANAFVKVGADWKVGCHWKAPSYNDDLLQAELCSLFARKMSKFAQAQVEDVVTSCDERLQIAPRSSCPGVQKDPSLWG